MSRILLTELNSTVVLNRKDGSQVSFFIKKFIGSGASCIVYLAECEDKTEHLLKEYYPKNLFLERDATGKLIIPQEKQHKFNEGLNRFKKGCETQIEIRKNEELRNYTFDIKGYLYGNGTEYIDSVYQSGNSYDTVEEDSLINLIQRIITLTKVVQIYHKKLDLLFLDLKPENIFVRPKKETTEDITLFDFDSITSKYDIINNNNLSYTKDWAAPEQLLSYKKSAISEATDLFSIGEILFVKIFGRHSTSTEHRSFANYAFDPNSNLFKNISPEVFDLLTQLFRKTIATDVKNRFQTADDLIALLEKIIPLADPQKPVLPRKKLVPKDGFIGRDAEMRDIHTTLQQNPILFLHGIGGIGKSELAKQYAARYQSEYDTVFFAPYDTDVVFSIANDSNIQINNFSRVEGEKIKDYYERKTQKLKELISENGERILFIVDNLDTTEDKNIKILFDLGCRVLITTRMNMGNIFKRPQIEIEAFRNISESRELFRQYYKFSDNESTDVDTIINLVQGHTLAIELIAKQIAAEWSTVQEIRTKLESGGLSSIGNEDIDNVKDDNLSQDCAFGHIKALFDLSVFEKENKTNELYVLSNLSLIPFTGIDRSLFANWCDLDNHGGKSCIHSLIKSGWIYIDGQNISVHPLVSNVCLASQKDSSIFDTFITNINKQIDIEKVFDSAEIYMYPPLFENIFSCVKKFGINSEIVFTFLWDILTWLNNNTWMLITVENIIEYVILHDSHQSLDLCRHRISCFISAMKYNAAYFDAANQYKAKLEYWQDMYKKLSAVFHEISKVSCERSFDKKTNLKILFKELSNQVEYYQDIGDSASEIAVYKKIINTYESIPTFELNTLGKQDRTLVDIFFNIATAYEKLEQYDNAIAIYKKSWDATLNSFDEKQLQDKENIYTSLLSCLLRTKKWSEAKNVLHQYFEWATKIFPENHPNFLRSIEKLLVCQILFISNVYELDRFVVNMYESCLEFERTFEIFLVTSRKCVSYSMPNVLINMLFEVADIVFNYVYLFLERTSDDYNGNELPPTDMDNQKAHHLLLFVKLIYEIIKNKSEIDKINAFIEYTNSLL